MSFIRNVGESKTLHLAYLKVIPVLLLFVDSEAMMEASVWGMISERQAEVDPYIYVCVCTHFTVGEAELISR